MRTAYVLVEAADGYQVVFSIPETHPGLGGREVLVANRANGEPLIAKLCAVPGDPRAWQELAAVLRAARIGVMAAIVAAFGSIISEVGAVMLVGGNIEGRTRVLTTAIVLNTRMGEFDLALALGIILLLLAFLANAVLFWLQQRAEG